MVQKSLDLEIQLPEQVVSVITKCLKRAISSLQKMLLLATSIEHTY